MLRVAFAVLILSALSGTAPAEPARMSFVPGLIVLRRTRASNASASSLESCRRNGT